MMEQTIYGLNNEAYHNSPPYSDFLSSTQLKNYLRSPKFAKFMLDNPQPQTEAQRFGSLFHDLMADLAECKGDWKSGYGKWLDGLARFDPPKNPKTNDYYGATTKAYAEAYQKFLEDNEGKTIAKTTDSDLASDMAHSLLFDCGTTSKQVLKFLKQAKAFEVSYFYETEDGIKLKIRPDLLTRNRLLIDWKTYGLDSLDDESIARQIVKYRYDVSMSMYQYVLHEILGIWYKPHLVFETKSAPFDAVIVDISEWCYDYNKKDDMVAMGVGAVEFVRLLNLHTKCKKANNWPGVESNLPKGEAIMKSEVPVWFGRKIFNE